METVTQYLFSSTDPSTVRPMKTALTNAQIRNAAEARKVYGDYFDAAMKARIVRDKLTDVRRAVIAQRHYAIRGYVTPGRDPNTVYYFHMRRDGRVGKSWVPVPADVVILSREGLAELVAANRIAAETAVDLARVGLGVAVRASAPKPDLGSVDAVKQALLKAKTVAVPGSTSGIWLKTDLFPRLGVADAIDIRMTPRGSDATAMVAAGGAGLAVMPVSEILVAPGVDFAGALPPQIQMVQVFAAAIVAGSTAMAAARRLIEFLASPQVAEKIRRSGMELSASSCARSWDTPLSRENAFSSVSHRSVFTGPGLTVLMRTPCRPYCSATDEAKLMSAALATPAVISQ